MQLYGRAGIVVQTDLMHIEFDKTIDKLSDQTVVNTSATWEYVAEIECQIRTTKERCRAIIRTLPFDIILKPIVTNIVYFLVLWLNTFLVRNGISKKYSLRSIVIPNKCSRLKSALAIRICMATVILTVPLPISRPSMGSTFLARSWWMGVRRNCQHY